MKTRRLLALALSFVMALACLPTAAVSVDRVNAEEGTRVQNTGNLQLDFDGSDGYTGDYVMIYNPNETYDSTRSTGDLSGLISTEIDSTPVSIGKTAGDEDELWIVDVDSEITEYDLQHDPHYDKIDEGGGVRVSYNVGDTKNFYVSSNYSPSGSTSLQFKVLYKSDHCYVWTTAANNENYYPLDSIDTSYAGLIAQEFDRIYPFMLNAFGEHSNGANGDGRVSLLFFNLDDGYEPGVSTSYTAGYFSGSSYTYDKMPVINLDTYPGLTRYVNDVLTPRPVSTCFHTFVHEYQHCINYSNGRMDSWLNEAYSGAAEEMCYPGSAISSRVQSWLNHKYGTIGDWLTPPTEVEYVSGWHQHTGFSLYNWEKGQADILAEYAQVLFFTQYIYSQYGNSKLRDIQDYYHSGDTEQQAIAHATGVSCSELVKRYRIALCANDPTSFGGLYGFNMQPDYVPADYHNVNNLYDLLCPVVFTGTSATLDGGSAIWVKPVNGVFYPPSGANSGLQYVGITKNAITIDYTRYEPAETVVDGGEYLIGYEDGDDVYVMLPYDPDYPVGSTAFGHIVGDDMMADSYVYGVKAVLDEYGNIIGFDDPSYPNALTEYAEWNFAGSGYGLSVGMTCMPGRFLYANPTFSGNKLYASDTETSIKWIYDPSLGTLTTTDTLVTKSVAYTAEAGGLEHLFGSTTGSGSALRLYKRVDGDNEQFHTVTFLDWDGAVIMSIRLPEGTDPIPPVPEREGYTFLGWDGEYEGAAGNVTVTATYSVNTYTLTIEYFYDFGWEAAPAYVAELEYGESYYVECPEIPYYAPEVDHIEGVMGAGGASYSVFYYPDYEVIPGDVDADGELTFADVTALYMYLVGVRELDWYCLLNADVDGDGTISFTDVSALAQILTA